MADKPDSGGFLAMIDAKIAALLQLRESFVAALSVGAFGAGGGDFDAAPFVAPGGAPSTPGGSAQNQNGKNSPVDLPTGVFRGQGLSDAVRLYLSMAKRKQSNRDIKAALMAGGLATTSDFFDQTLSSTLHRMRKTGELLQFPDGWDLAESYPESFRQRMSEAKEQPKKKAKKKVAKPAAKAAKPKPNTAEPAAKEKVGVNPQNVG